MPWATKRTKIRQTKPLITRRPVSQCTTLSQDHWLQLPFDFAKTENGKSKDKSHMTSSSIDDELDDDTLILEGLADSDHSSQTSSKDRCHFGISVSDLTVHKKRHVESHLTISPVDDELDDDILLLEGIAASDHPPQTSSTCSENYCFLDRYPPICFSDLAVHKKKLVELEEWLLMNRGWNRGCKLLLLNGPSGCGKTAAIQVLCNKLGISIIEWNSDGHFDVFYDTDGAEALYELSQAERFEKFLKKSDHSSCDKWRKMTLVLVEQLPHVFYRSPELFQYVLRKITKSVCMYVFIMSNLDSCWFLNPKRILPVIVAQEIGFHVISFNPCAVTFVTKALKRILSKVGVEMKSEQVRLIAQLSGGDIRSAVNNLQMYLTGGNACTDFQMCSPVFMDPFHCLGKLFYAKRSDVADAQWVSNEKRLSPINKRYFRPFPPKDDVSEVISKAGLRGDKLAVFISEHEFKFALSLETLRKVLENVSVVDSALSLWEARMDDALADFEAEMAARSTVFYNYGYKSVPDRGMYSFHKPRWKEVVAQGENKKKESLWTHPAHVNHREFFSLTLPLATLISRNIDSYLRSVYCSIFDPETDMDEFDIEEIDE